MNFSWLSITLVNCCYSRWLSSNINSVIIVIAVCFLFPNRFVGIFWIVQVTRSSCLAIRCFHSDWIWLCRTLWWRTTWPCFRHLLNYLMLSTAFASKYGHNSAFWVSSIYHILSWVNMNSLFLCKSHCSYISKIVPFSSYSYLSGFLSLYWNSRCSWTSCLIEAVCSDWFNFHSSDCFCLLRILNGSYSADGTCLVSFGALAVQFIIRRFISIRSSRRGCHSSMGCLECSTSNLGDRWSAFGRWFALFCCCIFDILAFQKCILGSSYFCCWKTTFSATYLFTNFWYSECHLTKAIQPSPV